MMVRVKLFAYYRELLGKKEMKMELEEGSRVGDLLDMLIKRNPKLGADKEGIVISVNYNYVPFEAVLKNGDEVALLPPVSGG